VRIPNGRLALCSAALLAVALAPAAAQTPSYATNEETIRGTISALDGKYALTLADERGFSDSVTLHDGTLISPAGASLVPGALVVITGHADGSTFDADAVDTDPTDAYETSATSDSYGPSGGPSYPALPRAVRLRVRFRVLRFRLSELSGRCGLLHLAARKLVRTQR
jgi:hypothetical protein